MILYIYSKSIILIYFTFFIDLFFFFFHLLDQFALLHSQSLSSSIFVFQSFRPFPCYIFVNIHFLYFDKKVFLAFFYFYFLSMSSSKYLSWILSPLFPFLPVFHLIYFKKIPHLLISSPFFSSFTTQTLSNIFYDLFSCHFLSFLHFIQYTIYFLLKNLFSLS